MGYFSRLSEDHPSQLITKPDYSIRIGFGTEALDEPEKRLLFKLSHFIICPHNTSIHEWCGFLTRVNDDVAHALLRAASPLLATPGDAR